MHDRQNAPLTLQLMGTPCWRTASDHGLLKGAAAQLAAYVIVNVRVERDVAVRLIWGDNSKLAIDAMSTAVKRLRVRTDHDVFLIKDGMISLHPAVACDLRVDVARWSIQDLLHRADFLLGIKSGTAELDNWVKRQRHQWYSVVCDALLARSVEIEEPVARATALAVASRAIECVPTLERAWCAKMWFHFLAGDCVAATRTHDELVELQGRLALTPTRDFEDRWRMVMHRANKPDERITSSLWRARTPQLVGRQQQLRELTAAWSTGFPILVQGDGGVGKSRLLADFMRGHGMPVIVDAIMGDQGAPYATLANILRALLRQQPLKRRRTTDKYLCVVLPEFGFPKPTVPVNEHAIVLAVECLLEEAAESGVRSIAIDNLHHCDLASLRVWRRVAMGSSQGIMKFALATRPLFDGPLRDAIEEWRVEPRPLQVVDLPPFSRTEVQTLLETVDLAAPMTRVNADDLYEKVGGNAFLLLSALRAISTRDDRTSVLVPTPMSAMPLQAARVRAVPEHALPLLRLMAVLGSDVQQASAALGESSANIARMLDELRSRRLVVHDRLEHDLVRETVINDLPVTDKACLHAVAAAFLTQDKRVPRARIAEHWKAAERWPEAGATFHEAGVEAGDAGRLLESRDLLRQAAASYRLSGDKAGAFRALNSSLEGELGLFGPTRTLAVVDELRDLAEKPEDLARIAIAQAEIVIAEHREGAASFVAAVDAVKQSLPYPHLRGDALAALVLGCAQSSRFEDAVSAAQEAQRVFETARNTRKALEVLSHLIYVYHEASRFGDAIASAGMVLPEYEAAGDRASAAIIGGNLSMLLLRSGDPTAAIAPAKTAHQRHCEVNCAAGPHAMNNRATLALAYCYAGRFDDAINILENSSANAESGLPKAILARCRTTMAHIWLILGNVEGAISALADLSEEWPTNMQMLAHRQMAVAARILEESDEAHLRRIRELQAANSNTSLSHSAWIEWGREGAALEAIEQMQRIHPLYLRAKMTGVARTALLTQVERMSELDDPASRSAAGSLARELRPQLESGLHAFVYYPEALLILAKAMVRAGDVTASNECLVQARLWVDKVAFGSVPAKYKQSFKWINPVNREIWLRTTDR